MLKQIVEEGEGGGGEQKYVEHLAAIGYSVDIYLTIF